MNEKTIYFQIKSYNRVIQFLDMEDVLQEIRIANLYIGQEFKKANNNIYRLSTEYGYSRKKGLDKYYHFNTERTLSDIDEKNLDKLELMYITRNMTVKEICFVLDIEYSNRISKLFCKVFKKRKKHAVTTNKKRLQNNNERNE